jgi:hypothetical protein
MATFTTTQTEPSSSAFEMQSFAPEIRPEDGNQKRLGVSDLEDVRAQANPPSTAVDALQKWNAPQINMWRVFATFWSFFVVGMNDGSYGVRFLLGSFIE